jgi:hypothetical protein
VDVREQRWAATGTTALVVAVTAATWAMCENALAWRETFRLEDLAYARGDYDDFEAYRPGWIGESATAWVAVVVLVAAVTVTVVAGVRGRRWPALRAAVSALAIVALAVAAGVVFPWVHLALPLVMVGAALTLRSFAAPAPQSYERGSASGPPSTPPPSTPPS